MRLLSIAFLTTAVLLMGSIPRAADAKAKIKVKSCTLTPQGTPWEQYAKEIIKHVRADSKGDIKVKVYWGGSKGNEKECAEKVKNNKLQMYAGTTAGINQFVPELDVFDLPFLWKSIEEADYVMDKHLMEPAKRALAAGGFVFYQWSENGWHGIGLTGKFIKSPADLQGMKIRIPHSRLHELIWTGFGATPVKLSPIKVSDALVDGTIDAFSMPPLYTFAGGWQAHISHYTISDHIFQQGMVAYSKTFFDSVAPQYQKIFLSNVQVDMDQGRKLIRTLAPTLIANLRDYGLNIYELTDAERATFSAKAKSIRNAFEKEASASTRAFLKAIDAGKAAFKK